MEVTLRIKRYNPEVDVKPVFREYNVEVESNDRMLDALNKVKWFSDGTLTFRRSCAHGICGTDAMRINGRNRLACKVLMGELGRKVTIEPLIGFAVIKDLVVDLDRFFDHYESVKPYLIADEAPAGRERLQSPAERDRFEDTTKCILCAACTTACPITWTNEEFVGPAAIVNAHRFTTAYPHPRFSLSDAPVGLIQIGIVAACGSSSRPPARSRFGRPAQGVASRLALPCCRVKLPKLFSPLAAS